MFAVAIAAATIPSGGGAVGGTGVEAVVHAPRVLVVITFPAIDGPTFQVLGMVMVVVLKPA